MRATSSLIASLTKEEQRLFGAYCVRLMSPVFYEIVAYTDDEPTELLFLVSKLVDELPQHNQLESEMGGLDRLTVVKAMTQLLPHAHDAAYPEYYLACFLQILVGATLAATKDAKDGAITALCETIHLAEAAFSFVYAEDAVGAIDEFFGAIDSFFEEKVASRTRLDFNLAHSAVPDMARRLRERLWATRPGR